ncbi:DNA-binding Lrp family transcriptional regulator [Hydrogenispora ethanolica]|jgi:DNA-binding Lrp family transcriptional regulator|uniref:siroheme decarboxylase n=1 Tax=Hydrogenispora ethanolica TaxID=1082276 RepID=A0A4R1RWN8_HYDET|nr:AsnC family transcriptional regulator [Hydrogenispora ethanolica]TCL70909.1 DNA-binding Lrp family transcriptional regulator [Hydrogenispora ethanolica]
MHLDLTDELLIREIQRDIPLNLDPYATIAEKIGCSKEEVIARLRTMRQEGSLRRIGAVLHHQVSGFTVNAMLVCKVSAGLVLAAGQQLAGLPEVSHCYQRRPQPDWPYNLYAMMHHRTRSEIEQAVAGFVGAFGIEEYELLYSIEELKKTSLVYFES